MTLDADIRAGLALLPAKMNTKAARLMLHAISRQENPRRLEQQVNGPARGDYQFEAGGGVKGVLEHSASRDEAVLVCKARGVNPTRFSVYEAIGHDPVLAAAMARLLLWTDPKPLPAIGQQQEAWDLYSRVWRPGKPHPEKWPANYAAALEAVSA
jgi:hypothetical protein